jgi:hypothetical protein
MKQGRMFPALGAALALTCAPLAAHAAPSKSASTPPAAPAARSSNPTRQFTGYVTALDRTSLTVEKRGRKPRTMAFTKDADMELSGVEKEARVTVYYRDEDGHAVAQRIVAKPTSARASRTPKAAKAPSNSR